MRLMGADSNGSSTKRISGRKRVLSFMSQFSSSHRDLSKSPPSSSANSTPASSPPRDDSPVSLGSFDNQNSKNHSKVSRPTDAAKPVPPAAHSELEPFPTLPTSDLSTSSFVQRPGTPPRAQTFSAPDADASPVNGSPLSTSGSPAAGRRRQRNNSQRPRSLVQTYQPPLMDVTEDTIPELQPIFTFLNSHANKLYQEGYFLKLDDQNTQGRPNPDRTWTECFAQLVGTVLSLWDAAELDAAGEDGEVLPKFINLTDASIKMIESLPTRSNDEQPLQNILSISTAGRNRYLLHFNSHQSLIQWTAGIRLAMYEHSTLQEAYTGALIAGKGKSLNNINIVMERARYKTEAWVRVRFGAGVPWRRCWCVITPPDEKEFQKQQKELKKRAPYNRSAVPTLKGDIKFYDTKVEGKKQKKAKPIASITDSYSAYAIYPQAKSLVDASTLLKIEGNITIHSEPPSSTEGFVFIMPETQPMVSGFEMLLRFLFPTWDTFGLYGRPGRLVASVLDSRSLMFAMPKHKRYGYMDIQDVSGLILTEGSSSWSEREWRKQMKELTGQKMNSVDDSAEPSKSHSRSNSRMSNRLSFNGNGSPGQPAPRARVGFADGGQASTITAVPSDPNMHNYTAFRPQQAPGGFDKDPYMNSNGQRQPIAMRSIMRDRAGTMEGMSSDDEQLSRNTPPPLESMRNLQTPEPVSQPPAFNHGPRSHPVSKPYHSPELRQANSRLSNSTLSHLANAGGLAAPTQGHPDGAHPEGRSGVDNAAFAQPSVHPHASPIGANANENGLNEAMRPPGSAPPAMPHLSQQRSRPQLAQPGYGPPPSPGPRSPMPPNHQQGGPGGALQPPYGSNFSRPDGTQTPPIGGPGRAPTPDMRSPGYGQPPPQFLREQRPQTPTADTSAGRGGQVEMSPPIHRKPVAERTPPSEQAIHRQYSERSVASSRYDDGSSVASPDYASTHKSAETQESVERPRAGVLKTVGSEPPVPPVPNASGYDIPEVDFGRTINYGASPRKQPATVVNPDGHRPYSPAMAAHHDADDMGDAGRAPWQSETSRGGHSRTPSNQAYMRRSKTPEPFAGRRRSSQDFMTHLRRKSADLLQGPGSRGANHGFDMGGSSEMPSHMSAREQEQIARMTGAPLVNMTGGGGGNRPQSPGGGGLLATIDARERERQQMKQGLNSQAVQHAAYRQQQQMHQQSPFPQQGYSQPMHGQPGWNPNPNSMGRGGGPGPYGPPRPQQQPPYGGGPMPPHQGGGYRPMPAPPGRMRQAAPPPLGPMPPVPHGQFGGGSRPQSPASPYGPRPQPGYRPQHQGHAF
ncbi:hypothetical protein ACRALDRAFT_2034174 [Sodiomyces alcalophilus JCM 7366]|uniref:uncharacterized protein n=1 Tax=Sodiomyces alcalophilus JCM 7366 TaxID=591952 RepID=UPI0039B4024D